ncbi:MAG: PD-(D/E)XK nuclease family protein [Desulfuromonas sp.]
MLYSVDEICAAAQRNALILTVNQRLARTLVHEYSQWQLGRGNSVWARPSVFTPAAWWQRCLLQHAGSANLLNHAQQQAIWRRIIRTDLKQREYVLLQVDATVKQALKAYTLLCDHLLAPDDSSSACRYNAATPEEQAFKRWYGTYMEYCTAHNYMDPQRLGAYVQEQFSQGIFTPPAELWLVGFDEVSPQLQAFTHTLMQLGTQIVEPEIEEKNSISEVYACADPIAELELVAHWAYTHITRGHSVGVIVPELERYQSSIERVFRQYATTFGAENIELNLSVGQPLRQYGAIQAALRLVQIEEPLGLDEFGYLLRSPWFRGGQQQMDEHAQAEAFLRTCGRPRASIETYARLLRQKGYFHSGIAAMCATLNHLVQIKERNAPALWLEIFNAALQKVGWPGDYPPDSQTYQVLRAWEEQILPLFTSLTSVEPKMSRMEAARQLQRLCTDSVFQAAARDNRLHIVGLLEGVALACDAVWVTGLHDQVLPSALNYNTFIPVTLQKSYAMPRASMEREIEFCTRLLHQLHALAPEVHFSYARCAEDGSVRGASPFLPAAQPGRDEWRQSALRLAAESPDVEQKDLELIQDSGGLSLAADYGGAAADSGGGKLAPAPPYAVKGGTYLLKEQAMCPFRAYAHFRMDVRGLETPAEGVDMRVRGSLLHLLLQHFWEEIKTQEQLLQLSTEQCRAVLTRHCQEIMEHNKHAYVPQNLHALELNRLVKLALEWLEIDKDRPPFKVLSVEEREVLQVGPLHIKAVADRVDQILPHAGMVLLDYKTGMVALKDIMGEHLLEPQLPVYALYGQQQPVVGFAVAQVRTGACALKGSCVSITGGEEETFSPLPLKSMAAAEWDAACAQWRAQLEALAQDIAAGRADVAPVQDNVCQFCDLAPLCRIKQQEPTAETDVTGEVDSDA